MEMLYPSVPSLLPGTEVNNTHKQSKHSASLFELRPTKDTMKTTLPFAFAFTLAAAGSLLLPATLPAAAGLANVRASQRAGTTLVDIRYDLGTANANSLFVSVGVST